MAAETGLGAWDEGDEAVDGVENRSLYEREMAALDLSDAEQAEYLSSEPDRASELYESADRHRRLAEQLDGAKSNREPRREDEDRRRA